MDDELDEEVVGVVEVEDTAEEIPEASSATAVEDVSDSVGRVEVGVATMSFAMDPEDETTVSETLEVELEDEAWVVAEALSAAAAAVTVGRPSILTVVGQPLLIVGYTISTVVAVEPPRVVTPVATPFSSNAGSSESSKMSFCAPSQTA